MKMKGAKQVHYDSGPNMTPLVDVVMVILIFLMLAGSFGRAEHFLTSNLPIKQSGGEGAPPPKPGEIPDEMLELRIDKDAQYGFRVSIGVETRGMTPTREVLKQKLEEKKAALNASGTPDDKIQVVLFPSREAAYVNIIAVYEAALAAKFEKVAFRTSQ